MRLLRDFPETKNASIIMLTGRADLDSVKEAMKYSIEGYTRKPYDPIELLERVKQTLDQN